jgi:hypothetical protein
MTLCSADRPTSQNCSLSLALIWEVYTRVENTTTASIRAKSRQQVLFRRYALPPNNTSITLVPNLSNTPQPPNAQGCREHDTRKTEPERSLIAL